MKDGRIVTMPAKRSRRLLVLNYAAALFEVGVHYSELEVNSKLRPVFDDYVALRRYLVESGHLMRDQAGREYRLPAVALAPK